MQNTTAPTQLISTLTLPNFSRMSATTGQHQHPFAPHYAASPVPCSRQAASYKINTARTSMKLQAGGSEVVIQIICYSQQDTTIKYVTFQMPTAFIPPLSPQHIHLKVISSMPKLCEIGRKYNTDGFKLTVINYMEKNGNHTTFPTLCNAAITSQTST